VQQGHGEIIEDMGHLHQKNHGMVKQCHGRMSEGKGDLQRGMEKEGTEHVHGKKVTVQYHTATKRRLWRGTCMVKEEQGTAEL